MTDFDVWTHDDPEFKLHCVYCGMCDDGGYPRGSAYRPHTLNADCWCIAAKQRGKCGLAIEFGLTQSKPKPPVRRGSIEAKIHQTEMIMRASGIRLADGEFRAAYESAIDDLRRGIISAR